MRLFPESSKVVPWAVLFALTTALRADAQSHVRLSPSAEFSALARNECASTIAATGWPQRGNARQTAAAAFFLLATSAASSDVDAALRNEVSVQLMDPQSAAFGRIVDPVTPDDPNDTAFGAEAWGPILLRYRDRISPQTASMLEEHARAALNYFASHPVSVEYTNIYLLTASEQVLLGDAVGDPQAVLRGLAALEQWIEVTGRSGIHEFESPTYFALDLDALTLGTSFSTSGQQRELFARAQDYVWREVAANTFVRDGRIAGAQSRSYDPLHGADVPMALHMMYAGLTDHVSDAEQIHCYDAYVLARDLGGYHIPSDVADLARKTPRIVEQRVANGPQYTKYTYVTDDYAIGSSNEDYDETGRVASIDLAASSKNLPVVRIVADKTGYYFGPTPRLQIDGERVWNHVKTRAAIVQDRNYMLILTDLDGGQPYDGGPLTLNVLLPSDGVLTVDELPLDLTIPGSRSLSPNSVVTVRVGSDIAGARIAMAQADGGGDAPLAIASDARGLAAGVVRAFATQATRTPASQTDVRGVVLLGVDSGPRAARVAANLRIATIRSTVQGDRWAVHADIAGRSFDVVYDIATHRSLSRRVDGREVSVGATLMVDKVPISI